MGAPFKARREDGRLVTGHGRYTSDWSLPGEAFAVFRRAEVAHAIIRSIDKEAAEALPGVLAVFIGTDVEDAGFGTIMPPISYAGRNGSRIVVPVRPILARDRVRFVGEEVALVVAESVHLAADAAERIAIEYDELPPVIGFDNAIADGAYVIHGAIPDNVCFDFEYGDEHATDELIARAAHVTRMTLESPRTAANPMEPRAVFARYDAAERRYEIRCSNQGGLSMRNALAEMMGVPRERIRVEMVDVGGGFGPRSAPYPEYALLLLAAERIGRPIKWVSTRSEDFLTDSHGRGIRLSGELALDEGGRFLAIRTSWLCDQGAYLTAAGPLTNTLNGQLIAAGPYAVQAFYGRHRLVITNTAPTNAYRGAGRPEAAYIVERLVEQAAAELGFDAIDLRQRNVVRPEQMSYRTLTGSLLDSGDFPALLDRARTESHWNGFDLRRETSCANGKLRGIGAALFVEPSGGGFEPKDEVAIRVSADGRLLVYVTSQPNGQGHETVLPALVAGWLGIDVERIELRPSDPDGPSLIGSGTIGSRTLMIHGSVLKVACETIIRKGRDLAAGMMEVAADELAFRDGHYALSGTNRSVSMLDVIVHYGGPGPHPLDTIAELPLARAFPSGAHVAEVEIDPDTGVSEIVAYTAVDDIGTVISPVLAAGQLRGGIMQGLGQVFGEMCHFDADSGQMVSASFMDYPMPRGDQSPPIRVVEQPVPSPTNPLGAKGVGEAGTIGALPTLMNAIVCALRQAGVEVFDMPATPARVWAAIGAARSGGVPIAAEDIGAVHPLDIILTRAGT